MNGLGNSPTDKNYKPSGISKAEERAMEKYPIYWAKAVMSDGNIIDLDANETTRNVFKLGYEQAEKDLGWHSVDESIPPMGEEVIVLTNMMNGIYLSSARRLSFGHIVNKEICTDFDGWNIPGVKYWMPCPELEELK